MIRHIVLLGISIFYILFASLGDAQENSVKTVPRGTPVRAPGADLRKVVIWGSECKQPEGQGLSFGGQHQRAEDGRPHTRILDGGKWVAIHEELRKNNPVQKYHDALWALHAELKNARARARYIYFQGRTEAEEIAFLKKEVNPALEKAAASLATLAKNIEASGGNSYTKGQAAFALTHLRTAQPTVKPFAGCTSPELLIGLRKAQVKIEIASEAFDSEPPPRVCSKIVYDAKTGFYAIFGGDHYDYLTNDLWVFDPAKRKWFQHHPDAAPEPRSNHYVKAEGNGKIFMSGGYIYREQFNYGESSYGSAGNEMWTYDIPAQKWVSSADTKTFTPDSRIYRGAKFLPDFYLQGPRPDAAVHEAKLKAIPVNTWVDMTPPKSKRPQKMQMNRGWGTSVLDNDHDLILQWGGGHSAAGGTDVLHYHMATGRWEQPYPIEYCLGLVCSPSTYPCGYNFNRHPWIIMHAYKSYAYETKLKQMVLTGRNVNWTYSHDFSFYLYDPMIGNWTTRHPLHPKMGGTQYYLKSRVISSPHGLLFWSQGRDAFRLNTEALKWEQIKLQGKLPGCGTDGGGLVYDSKRNRMLMVAKPWKPQAKGVFQGKITALDLKTNMLTVLEPKGTDKVTYLFLREAAYNPDADIFIWAAQKGGKTIAYDPNVNRWIALKISGKAVFSFSSGHVYDSKRRLHWVADGGGGVFCMRLDMKSIEIE